MSAAQKVHRTTNDNDLALNRLLIEFANAWRDYDLACKCHGHLSANASRARVEMIKQEKRMRWVANKIIGTTMRTPNDQR